MIEIDIPGFGHLLLEHLVLDFNGTLATDGQLLSGVADSLQRLAQRLSVHVVTGDTYGSVANQLQGQAIHLVTLGPSDQALAKVKFIAELGPGRVAAIGNGRSDVGMLDAAVLAIAVVGDEGSASALVASADVIVTSIAAALALLANERRLVATSRS